MMTRVTALILAITMVFVVACGSKEVDKAKQYMDAGMYEQAMELLKMEVGSNPKNAEAHYLLGTCYLMQNNGHEAQESFERAILLEPKYRERIGEAYIQVAKRHLDQGDLSQGQMYLEEAVGRNFLTKEAKAKIMIDAVTKLPAEVGQASRAVEVLRESVQQTPSMREEVGKACMKMGKQYVDYKMFDDADTLLQVATELDPANIKPASQLYYEMGANVLDSVGDAYKAIPLLDESMKLSPDMRGDLADLYFDAATRYGDAGNKHTALVLVSKSKDLDPKYIKGYQEMVQEIGGDYYAPEPSMIALWHFDEGEGNTVRDGSDNGHDVTIFGARWVAGKFGAAIEFDGQNDYLEIPNAQDINLRTVQERTISIWFKLTDESGSDKQVIYEEGGVNKGLNVYLHHGNLYVGGWNEPHWQGTWLSTETISRNTWHNVVLCLRGTNSVTNDAIKGYLDGEEFASGHGCQLLSHDGNVRIGMNGDTKFHKGDDYGGEYFKGLVDEIVIFDRALSPEEIQARYAALSG